MCIVARETTRTTRIISRHSPPEPHYAGVVSHGPVGLSPESSDEAHLLALAFGSLTALVVFSYPEDRTRGCVVWGICAPQGGPLYSATCPGSEVAQGTSYPFCSVVTCWWRVSQVEMAGGDGVANPSDVCWGKFALFGIRVIAINGV